LWIAVSCILSMCPSHRIRWILINLTIFSPLIMSSNNSETYYQKSGILEGAEGRRRLSVIDAELLSH
jgi:hypothetical protein